MKGTYPYLATTPVKALKLADQGMSYGMYLSRIRLYLAIYVNSSVRGQVAAKGRSQKCSYALKQTF